MTELLKTMEDARIRWETGCPLAPYSTFRIGGAAALAVFPDSREKLILAAKLLRRAFGEFRTVGNASNVVFPDGGIGGAVLFTRGAKTVTVSGNEILADAGASLSSVADAAREAGLSGAEFLYGIPGTVGGAVFMNAGAFGGCMADVCAFSEYLSPDGTLGTFSGDAQEFGNRTSVYANHPEYTVTGATLRLTPGDRKEIHAKMEDFLARRRATQPLEYPSAGSVFKRPEGNYAGKLIEDCGLKGMSVGGACVSEKHAGFIVNTGGATARDVRRLVEIIRATVAEKTGVTLECEIRFF